MSKTAKSGKQEKITKEIKVDELKLEFTIHPFKSYIFEITRRHNKKVETGSYVKEGRNLSYEEIDLLFADFLLNYEEDEGKENKD